MGSEQSGRLLREGYAFIGTLRREHNADVVPVRLFGLPVTCMGGSEAAELFYDRERFTRVGVVPGPVKRTLFGKGGVHGLDGPEHLVRKSLFTSVVTPESTARLAQLAASEWEAAAERWAARPQVRLFDEAALVLTRAVTRWAQAPLPRAGAEELSRSLTAMVDGFATLGARHWRARAARSRTELWATTLIDDVRSGTLEVDGDSVLAKVAAHRDGAEPLPSRVASVELLNIIRPTVAVTWFVCFAAHALLHHDYWRGRLRDGDDDDALAFAQELRRFYPFAPLLGARVRQDFSWHGNDFPAGRLVLLDLYGTNHDGRLWPDPEVFDPTRFLSRQPTPYDLIPQGGGRSETGHRCPGEPFTLRLLADACKLLSGLDYQVPVQDLSIPLDRIPTLPRSGFLIVGSKR